MEKIHTFWLFSIRNVKHFCSKKWVENIINDWVITFKSHQIILPWYSVVWKIIQEKLSKLKIKKHESKFSQRIDSNLSVFFSLQTSYRHKTTKVTYRNPIDLIFGSKSVFLTFLWITAATTHWTVSLLMHKISLRWPACSYSIHYFQMP